MTVRRRRSRLAWKRLSRDNGRRERPRIMGGGRGRLGHVGRGIVNGFKE